MSLPARLRGDTAAVKERSSTQAMFRRTRHILTLIPSEAGLALAEVRAGGNEPEIVRTSSLPLVQPLEKPTQNGEALAQHLSEQGYTARQVIVGLSATRVLARHKLLPQPPDEAQLQDMLRLAIERELTAAGRGLRVDYCKQRGDDGKLSVLLVATAEDVVTRLETLIAAAKLQLHAVTPTLLALAVDDAQPTRSPERSLLLVDDHGAELLMRGERGPTGLTRFGADDSTRTDALADAVMRVLAGAPRATPLELVCEPAHESSASALAGALREWVEVEGPRTVSPAMALARPALRGEALGVDLAHHKLGADGRAAHWRRRRVATWAAVCLLLLGVLVGVGWHQTVTPVQRLEREYDRLRASAGEVERLRERTLAAEPWLSSQTVHLRCLWDLTRLFPEDERIWVRHMRLGAAEGGAIQCRAGSRQAMLELFAAMEDAPAFEEVALRDWQEVDANEAGVRFEITFRHVRGAPALADAEGSR